MDEKRGPLPIIFKQHEAVIRHYFPNYPFKFRKTMIGDVRRYYAKLACSYYDLEPSGKSSDEDLITIIRYFQEDLKLTKKQLDILSQTDWAETYVRYYLPLHKK